MINKNKIRKLALSILTEHYANSNLKLKTLNGLSEEDKEMFSRVFKLKEGPAYYQYHKYGAMRDD